MPCTSGWACGEFSVSVSRQVRPPSSDKKNPATRHPITTVSLFWREAAMQLQGLPGELPWLPAASAKLLLGWTNSGFEGVHFLPASFDVHNIKGEPLSSELTAYIFS